MDNKISIAFSLSVNETPLEFYSGDGFTVLKDGDGDEIYVPLVIFNDQSFDEIRESLHKTIDLAFDKFIEESNNE